MPVSSELDLYALSLSVDRLQPVTHRKYQATVAGSGISLRLFLYKSRPKPRLPPRRPPFSSPAEPPLPSVFSVIYGLTTLVMIAAGHRELESPSHSPALGFPRPRFFRYRRLR
ncbi:hypothetical protein NL676_031183 [Syzygium grande]|nr:hypothetical protein NL676_031183 [Syzygium grande]